MFVFWQVGSDFGYFPKDLLEINHNYSNEELELPTDVSLICPGSFVWLFCFFFQLGVYCFLPWHSEKFPRKKLGMQVIFSNFLLVSS